MAREGDGPLGMPGDDGAGRSKADPRRDEPIVRRFDPHAAAALNAIARQLGVPVERFYGAPAGAGSGGAIGAGDRREQEERLLRAYRRVADPALRRGLVELAETLAAEP